MRLACLAVIVSLLSSPAMAQGGLPVPRHTLTLWTAGASNQSLYEAYGTTHDRSMSMVGLERGWLLRGDDSSRVTLHYLAGLVPNVTVGGIPVWEMGPQWVCPYGACYLTQGLQEVRRTVRGIALLPVGLDTRMRVLDRLSARLHATAGLVRFSRPVPHPEARRVNFMGDVGASLDVRIAARVAITAGMRVNHVSNAHTARVNPGMDSMLPQIGITYGR